MLQEAAVKTRGAGRGRASCTRPRSSNDSRTPGWKQASATPRRSPSHSLDTPATEPHTSDALGSQRTSKLCSIGYTTFQTRARGHKDATASHQTAV